MEPLHWIIPNLLTKAWIGLHVDFSLWDTLKDYVYGNHPTTLNELESLICVAPGSISVQTLQDVMVNITARLQTLYTVASGHFENNVMWLQKPLAEIGFFLCMLIRLFNFEIENFFAGPYIKTPENSETWVRPTYSSKTF